LAGTYAVGASPFDAGLMTAFGFSGYGTRKKSARRLLSRRAVHAVAQGTVPNTADEAHARTMAFTTLMMFQLFDVYNCRSRRRSALSGFFENKWLLGALAFSLGAHVLVIYVPFLQMAFHTVPLSMTDWLIATLASSTLLFGMEAAKIVLRVVRPDPYAWPAREHSGAKERGVSRGEVPSRT
jgi:magnesium-transporting ATPase (P-type)